MKNIAESMRILAEKAHAGQFRKWATPQLPYIVHPIRVAEKVAALKGTNEVDVGVAYGHDILEDCGDHYESEIAAIDLEVLALVKELTFPTDKPEWKDKPRAEKNVIRFKQMRGMSPRAQRIKMVDRWDNLQDMVNAPHRLKRKTIDESWELLSICKEADLEMAKELEDMIRKLSKT